MERSDLPFLPNEQNTYHPPSHSKSLPLQRKTAFGQGSHVVVPPRVGNARITCRGPTPCRKCSHVFPVLQETNARVMALLRWPQIVQMSKALVFGSFSSTLWQCFSFYQGFQICGPPNALPETVSGMGAYIMWSGVCGLSLYSAQKYSMQYPSH